MNYYPHHIGDYLRDTAHLSALEDGIYRRLIDLYYVQEKPLTNDIEKICRLIRITSKNEKILTKKILKEFFVESDLFFIHTRCDVEIAKFKYKGTKARDSANARWQPIKEQKNSDTNTLKNECERNANAMRIECESDANQEPRTKNQEPILNKSFNKDLLEEKKKTKFIKPTIQEIQSFIEEKNYNVNPINFFNFYESKDWFVGKNKMKCWKSALTGWHARSENKPKSRMSLAGIDYKEGVDENGRF